MNAPRSLIRLLAALIVAAGLASSTACSIFTMAPVLQISHRHLTPTTGAPLTAAEVRLLVLQGLAMKGWTVDREEASAIVASVSAGGHQATVRVDYNSAGYSISYVASSKGLKYDGENIHRRYNRWVDFLDKAIRQAFANSQVSRSQTPAAPPGTAPASPGAIENATPPGDNSAGGIEPAPEPAPTTPAGTPPPQPVQ